MSDPLIDYGLWSLTDEQLEDELAAAETVERLARMKAFDCRFHMAVRRNMKKNEIQTRISELEAELAAIRDAA